jgi:hypothetical protein
MIWKSKSSALKMEQIECSETSANINQMPGKHPKVSTLDTECGESLKSRNLKTLLMQKEDNYFEGDNLSSKFYK